MLCELPERTLVPVELHGGDLVLRNSNDVRVAAVLKQNCRLSVAALAANCHFGQLIGRN